MSSSVMTPPSINLKCPIKKVRDTAGAEIVGEPQIGGTVLFLLNRTSYEHAMKTDRQMAKKFQVQRKDLF